MCMTVERFKKIDISEYKNSTTFTKVNGKRSTEYFADFGTIDTEVTTVPVGEDNGVGLLYIWMVCLFGKYFIHGRTLDELKELVRYLYKELGIGYKKRLVLYCHNLEYDWQFINPIFKKFEYFATDKRAVLYAYAWGIEFRCSYKLSNMSLEKFAETMKAEHQKQSGEEFDYSKIRTPDTRIGSKDFTFKNMFYCYCDVVGLYESVKQQMLQDCDNIVTIPLTSTGYVRRDCRNAMRKNKRNRTIFESMQLNPHTYQFCKDAFRGGNTHANRHIAGQLLKNIVSYDIASSYPSCIMYEKFMMKPLKPIDIKDANTLAKLLKRDDIGLLLDVTFTNIRTEAPIPYLAIDKCRKLSLQNFVNDNGRILRAEEARLRCLDDDLRIILKQYEFDDMIINEAYYAEEDYLPKELREVCSDYFVKKTTLKNVPGEENEYLYAKSKNKLNGIFGMMVQDPVHKLITYKDGEWIEKDVDIDNSLDKFYNSRNNFLSYIWGVQITAKARTRLQEAIDIVGENICYVDTDSVKFKYDKAICDKIDAINARIMNMAQNSDVQCQAYTKDGELQTLGLWDNETTKYDNGVYDKFRTFGAKKYAVEYTKKGKSKFEITVAGLNKKKGAKEIGRIENFLAGITIVDSGRTRSIYDDNREEHFVEVNGKEYPIYSNIAILPTTYTLGVTEEYTQVAENIWEGMNDET